MQVPDSSLPCLYSVDDAISLEAEKALEAGLRSAREEKPISLGSFSRYLDE